MTSVGFTNAFDAKRGMVFVEQNIGKTKPQPAARLAPALSTLLKQMSSQT